MPRDQYSFYKPHDEYKDNIEQFLDHLNCLDDSFELMGQWNSDVGKQLVIGFKVCEDPLNARVKKCRDYETFIKPWMSRKFMITVENQK